MKKSRLLSAVWAVLFTVISVPAIAPAITFDDLEVAASDRHQLSSYTGSGLTFTGLDPPPSLTLVYGMKARRVMGIRALRPFT